MSRSAHIGRRAWRRRLTPGQWLLIALAVAALLWYASQIAVNRLLPQLGGARCDPSYPTRCIPPPPPDLDCRSVEAKRFLVLPPDPHGFDADGDRIGCE